MTFTGVGTAVITDLGAYMQSLTQMLDARPLRLYPGHGPHLDDGCGKLREYIAHRDTRFRQIKAALDEYGSRGASARELTRSIYLGTPENLMEAAMHNVIVVLQKLAEDGAVVCSDQRNPKAAIFAMLEHKL